MHWVGGWEGGDMGGRVGYEAGGSLYVRALECVQLLQVGE